MSDEVETAEEVAEALYERRVGKVVKLASFAAADMPVDADGMTTEERQLFDDLVDRISGNKSRVLDVLSGEASPAGDPGPVDPRTTGQADGPAPPEPAAADEEPASPSADSEPGSTADEAGALAGAMGGAEETVDADDTIDADKAVDASDANDPDDAVTDEIAALDGSPEDPTEAGDDGPTAVPPEPAPPGAPGVTEGDGGAAPSDPSGEGGADPDGPGDADPSETALDDDRATVRITRDVGAIFGVDEREYDLASEDVVTLPVENADPLVARDAAERLD